ncbi:hypothetical protein BVJ53_00435 [Lacticaseibacillus chiayiensis]|uniref:DUF4874 domain-containing protein n=1 Tax=Lacticaseibacillus chiayiensis TaxID=2100821 RepID=A0A4Q1UHM8_9LACO|nr:hypothetical protein BVJ53_00435 [Lacticaseibacillus chiayiensis]
MKTVITPKMLPGSRSSELLQNPDRGFRLEVYLNVASNKGIYEYADWNAIDALKHEVSLYREEQPTIAQVYFYLTDYRDRPLDQTAFQNMQAYFDAINQLHLKALLRFAYVWDDANPTRQAATLSMMKTHLQQLAPFLQKNRAAIYALQAGMIGAWGEWAFRSRERIDETELLKSLLVNTPDDLKIQVRYLNIKNRNLNVDDAVSLSRIGFHDDFLIGIPHIWNTAGKNEKSSEYQQLLRDSKQTLVDGEMSWFWANPIYLKTPFIDPVMMVNRLVKGSFTTFSLAHNYQEGETGSFTSTTWKNELKRAGVSEEELPSGGSLAEWKDVPITPQILHDHHWPFQESWFVDEKQKPIQRNYFEYIRDYLGYRISVKSIAYGPKTDIVQVILRNDGFAAPLGLDRISLMVIGQSHQTLGEANIPKASLVSGQDVSFVVPIQRGQTPISLGILLRATNGETARVANLAEFADGINWFAFS